MLNKIIRKLRELYYRSSSKRYIKYLSPEMKEVIKRQLGAMYESYVKTHKAQYRGFYEFLIAAGVMQ